MPGSVHLLYTTPTRDGVTVYNMNTQTGKVSFMYKANYNVSVSVSPDGKQLTFEEMPPLDKYGLFVSNLDSTNRIQFADGDPYIVTSPTWSPEGNWVIASIHDPRMSSQPNPTLALIEVNTCQIIPLSNLTGYVFSWLP